MKCQSFALAAMLMVLVPFPAPATTANAVVEGNSRIVPPGVWHYNYPGTAFPAFDAATDVDFGLVSRGSLIARECFSIGTAIPFCEVLRVKHADGSMWTNAPPPQR